MLESTADYSADSEKSRARFAVVYSRITAPGPTALRASFDLEERHCRRWARDNSCCIVEYIRDKSSTINPPGFRRLRELLNERNVDLVLAYSPDRFSRCHDQLQQLLAELDQAGASHEFVVNYPTSIRRSRQR